MSHVIYYSGPAEDSENLYHEQRGVIPRSFEYLYSLIKQEMDEVSLHHDNGCNIKR